MHIKLSEDLPEAANACLSSIMVVLKELFGKHEQLASMADAEQVSVGPVIMPMLAFEPKRVHLKNNGIKNTHCVARFVVYSKPLQTEELKEGEEDTPEKKLARQFANAECSRFIHANRCITDVEELFKKIPAPVRDAYFDEDGVQTIAGLVSMVGNIKAEKVSYFYNPCTCEGVITHSIAVVHEFKNDNKPYCVFTTYLTINVSK